MKQRLYSLLVIVILAMPSMARVVSADEATQADLKITEVKIKNTATEQKDEFIEIYNNDLVEVELSNYFLEYFNSYDPLGSEPSVHKGPFALPEYTLLPNEFVVLAMHPEVIEDALQLEEITSLKDGEGQLRLLLLVDEEEEAYGLVDQISWKDGGLYPSGVSPAPADRVHSLQRWAAVDDVPFMLEEGWIADAPTPGSLGVVLPPDEDEPEDAAPIDTDEEPEGDEEPLDTEETPEEVLGATDDTQEPDLIAPVITELLPNPSSPQTDNDDEFVEIYNPNEVAYALDGFEVQTGSNYTYKHNLTGEVIPPRGYLLVTSGATSIALANSGGKARLVAPDGSTVSEAVAYEKAAEGQAWALNDDGAWSWTTTATPGAGNVFTVPAPKVAAAKTPAKKTSTKRKAATTKAKSTSTKKSSDATARAEYEEPEAVKIPPVHNSVIAGVSTLAVLYAGYEYRHDLSNRLYQFRRHRAARRAARAASSGR